MCGNNFYLNMVRIKKTIDMGFGWEIKLVIDDGIALMTCNNAIALRKIYFEGKKKGKNLNYDFRKNIMYEKLDGKSAEEIWSLLEKDISTAKSAQKQTIEDSKKAIKEKDK